MAYEHGIAAGNVDLWNKLLAFLTTNPDLVAANENWSVAWTHAQGQPRGVVLKGPGATGADSIFVGLRRFDAAAADEQEIRIWGMSGLLGSAAEVTAHINVSGGAHSFFDSGNMEYWMVASGRRFILVAKMSTVYSAIYGGFFLPYANPLSYPYPLFIGGSAPYRPDETDSRYPKRWRDQQTYHSHFHSARELDFAGGIQRRDRSAAWYLSSTGAWEMVTRSDKTTNSYHSFLPYAASNTDPDGQNNWPSDNDSGDTPFRLNQLARMEESVGGGFALNQCTLIRELPLVETVGVLDGVYHVPGQNNAVENIVTVDGIDHLVVQNVFRTEVTEYWALRLS